jgi:CMP-N,N'-diacetyllegionaminic acid synthase
VIENKKILAVITARGGSKGVPGKNCRKLMGEPLFMWSVYASLASQYIDKTVISSNCPEVEKIYTKRMYTGSGWDTVNTSNLEFIKRPDEISGDLSKNEEALLHAYNWMKDKDEEFAVVINLQPTSPIRTKRLLDRCIEEYHKGGYDSLLTGSKHTPFLWQKKNGKWEYIDRHFSIANVKKPYQKSKQWQMVKSFDDCCKRKMRQELTEEEFFYHDSGNIFISNAKMLLSTGCRIGKNPCVFEVDRFNSLQIDEEFDFQLIEEMAKAKGLNTLVDGWTDL